MQQAVCAQFWHHTKAHGLGAAHPQQGAQVHPGFKNKQWGEQACNVGWVLLYFVVCGLMVIFNSLAMVAVPISDRRCRLSCIADTKLRIQTRSQILPGLSLQINAILMEVYEGPSTMITKRTRSKGYSISIWQMCQLIFLNNVYKRNIMLEQK